jgi:hypothetical protein
MLARRCWSFAGLLSRHVARNVSMKLPQAVGSIVRRGVGGFVDRKRCYGKQRAYPKMAVMMWFTAKAAPYARTSM